MAFKYKFTYPNIRSIDCTMENSSEIKLIEIAEHGSEWLKKEGIFC